MAPRPDVSEERKNQILEAATRVFTQRGFDEARMDDIVEEAGLSKGALYWYFDSKEALITTIVDRVFDWETAHMRKILDSQASAPRKLEAIIDVTVQDLDRMKSLMPILFEFWSLSLRKESVNIAIKRYYQRFLDLIEPIIQQGIQEGDFRPVDIPQAAISIGAVFEGTILMWAYFPEKVNFQDQFKTNLDLVLSGLIMNS
ncbi:MAG: TetR/AcrR family transcriptional regulator [Anaerolineales bacterium]